MNAVPVTILTRPAGLPCCCACTGAAAASAKPRTTAGRRREVIESSCHQNDTRLRTSAGAAARKSVDEVTKPAGRAGGIDAEPLQYPLYRSNVHRPCRRPCSGLCGRLRQLQAGEQRRDPGIAPERIELRRHLRPEEEPVLLRD